MKIQPTQPPYPGFNKWNDEPHNKYLAWRAKQKEVKPLEEVINNASQVVDISV